MFEIGVMQGRLVPQVDGKIQAFPWAHWQEEFYLAAQAGFPTMEFIFDASRFQENPLFSEEGVVTLQSFMQETGVKIDSVCADYFMAFPFYRVSERDRDHRIKVLKRLISFAAKVGVRYVEIHCVDASAIGTEDEKRVLYRVFQAVREEVENDGVEILFETSLPPEAFLSFLAQFQHPAVGANFDIGNSASLGYAPAHEIKTLGKFIKNIHIKDRVLGGSTVPLGEGNADFKTVFQTLKTIGYRGDFILQTARDPDHLGVALKYRQMVQGWIKDYLQDGLTVKR